ncbi:unnamed protein product, partial [Staurois parvus]
MLLTLMGSGENVLKTLVVSGKNAPYKGGQWGKNTLHLWSRGRMLFTLVVNGKNAPYTG